MYELANTLSIGSTIRLAGDSNEPVDGHVENVRDDRLVVNFGRWYEIWQVADLTYEPATGIWRAGKRTDITPGS